jgi:hypothetical protein
MVRPHKPTDELHAFNLGLRILESDNERLETLARRIMGATKHGIARVALRLGLELLERDPSRIVVTEKNPRRARR